MPYRASLKRKPNASYRRGPYKASKSKPKATLSSGGANGAVQRMSAGFQQPQEIKSHDIAITTSAGVSPYAPGTGNWNLMSTNSIQSIIQGTAGDERIGRNIRVVGIVMRMTINTSPILTESPIEGQPWTIDCIWDKQPNGATPAITTIYSNGDRNGLPNPNFQKRFSFFKRLSLSGTQGVPTGLQIVDRMIKCNKLISYDASDGTISNIETNNLLITMCTVDPAPSVSGYVRILYVDA